MTLKTRWIAIYLALFAIIAGLAYQGGVRQANAASASDWKATLRDLRAIGPYTYGTVLTKSDSTIVSCRGLYVGGAGNLNIKTLNGDTVLLTGALVGTVYPIAITQLLSTSTTATLVACLN